MQLKNMMTVDGVPVLIEGERNLLEVIAKVGTIMPVFCYHSYLSIYGACRMCMVEDDRGRLLAACSTLPEEGMKIRTNTGRLRRYRKNILELLLAAGGQFLALHRAGAGKVHTLRRLRAGVQRGAARGGHRLCPPRQQRDHKHRL